MVYGPRYRAVSESNLRAEPAILVHARWVSAYRSGLGSTHRRLRGEPTLRARACNNLAAFGHRDYSPVGLGAGHGVASF
jgi:hypothetical protein